MSDTPDIPQPPPAQDPRIAINAEARANRYNVNSPYGTVRWSGNPETGMTQTTKLSPAQQRQLTLRNQIADTMFRGARGNIKKILPGSFNFDKAGGRAAQAEFARQRAYLDPLRERQDEQLDQKLANMGLPMGSEAYSEDKRQFNQNWNDAYAQAARQAELTGANLALQERGQNYNEIAAALGNQQVAPNAPGGMLDVSGAYARQQAAQNQAYQGQLAGYNADVASQNSMMGGLFGLGGSLGAAAILASDVRLKTDVKPLGIRWGGFPVYSFKYKGSDTEHIGVMAQEVQESRPDAIVVSPNGFLWVDYGALA